MSGVSHAVLLCGVAADRAVWNDTEILLRDKGFTVDIPRRPRSGDLDREIEFLEPLCADAFVVGVSGGATLGLELAARGVPMRAAVLHEPAAGSLAPGLLDHVSLGFRTGGVEGFGRALYGSRWHRGLTDADELTVAREFAMFRSFEPSQPAIDPRVLTLTVGESSPHARQESVRALSELLGIERRVLANTSHAAHLDNAFEAVLNDLINRASDRQPMMGSDNDD